MLIERCEKNERQDRQDAGRERGQCSREEPQENADHAANGASARLVEHRPDPALVGLADRTGELGLALVQDKRALHLRLEPLHKILLRIEIYAEALDSGVRGLPRELVEDRKLRLARR